MARFVAGDVVVVPFPFTDLASSKVRPAAVLATSTRGDILLCQITSKDMGHPEAVAVKMTDFASAEKLPRDSFALPHRLVTANESCVAARQGICKMPNCARSAIGSALLSWRENELFDG